jgi:pyridoxal phosphate enzyme (YggS family)
MSTALTRNLPLIERRIESACRRVGRERSTVSLIGVTKTFPATVIDEAFAAGITEIGENRVQELREKAAVIRSRPHLHLIGHLQSNKAKDAARLADVIHTIDSIPLAEKLDRAATDASRKIDILVQVNVGQEPQKSGVTRDEARSLAESLLAFSALRLVGLMTIPPALAPEEVRPYFRELRDLLDELRRDSRFSEVRHLSMGMSEDFEVAIEEGATMIRLGRALFGERG